MSSLRRDLLNRRLWPVIVLLLVAVVALPLTLRKSGHTDVTPTSPAPPVAGAVAVVAHTAARKPAHAVGIGTARNPFAGGTPTRNAKPRSGTTAGSTSAATAASSATASTTSPTMVSPSPTASSSDASSNSPTTPATAATPSTATATTPSTATPTKTAPSTATTTTTQTTTTPPRTTTTTPPSVISAPAAVRSWTLYSVAVRIGTVGFAIQRSDIARLTPIPSVAHPEAMFMGVTAGGRHAVFALGAGVQHAGPGVCRPDRKRCAAILLRVGQTEQLTAPAAGGPRELNLRLVGIADWVTHSRAEALAVYQRHSAAGLCELNLADPLTYSPSAGTVSPVAVAACKHRPDAVPFPGGVVAP